MSFLTTQTEELLAAEQLLSGINTNLAAQNAGAAAATTVVAPAAADPVSIQQAAIFSTYGTTYQTIATEAQTLLENYAQTLGISSNSYGTTEAVNAAQGVLSGSNIASPLATATPSTSPLDFLSYLLGSPGGSTNPAMLGGIFGLSSNGANIGNIGVGNWASAGSDLLGLAGGGLLDLLPPTTPVAAGRRTSPADGARGRWRHGRHGRDAGGLDGPGDHGQQHVGAAELGRFGHPGGRHRAPHRCRPWAGPPPRRKPARAAIIPGMPGMGAAARNSAGFGAPRYGVKPIVMPKPTAV